MMTERITTVKNHVSFHLVFTPEELRSCGGDMSGAVQTLLSQRCDAVLADLGWRAADPPACTFSNEGLSVDVRVTCHPVVEARHYKGLSLTPEERALPDETLQELLLDKIIAAVDFDLPDTIVEQQVAPLITGLRQQLKYDAMAQGKFLDPFGAEMEERLHWIDGQAIRQVKAELVLDAILAAETFQVTPDELEAEAQAIAARQGMSVESVKDFLGAELTPLQKDLRIRKALELALCHAVEADKMGGGLDSALP